jgi:hypothetical protein
MTGSGNQGRGNTIRRRTREGGEPPPRAAGSARVPVARTMPERVVPQAVAAAAAVAAPVRAPAVGTRPPGRQQETLKLGGHTIRVEREDERVHLVLGGVFRLMMSYEEAEQLSAALATLVAGGKSDR